ncbi:hypothetical protein ACWGEA_20450 [Streptomyces zaomyceticus]
MTPPHPHRKFKKAPDWYEEMHERQRKAHSSRRIRVVHGIHAYLKNWRALTRRLGRRGYISDTVQAVAGLLYHQQSALHPRRQQ